MKIALLGAESTGKTELAQALVRHLHAQGRPAHWVPEVLREWCNRQGRTPQPHEQAAIAHEQAQRVASAPPGAVVVADTTPLMTAVYSELLFADRSLYPMALAHQRSYHFTLLTGLDLPWVADGLQRDGPHVREPVDTLVREALIAHALPWSLVAGTGHERLENALDAVAPLLRPRAAPRRGLFTRLDERNAQDRPWSCELCDDPDCEHLARLARRGSLDRAG